MKKGVMYMKTLEALYNPTLDGVEYSGLFAALLLKYSYAPSYISAISAVILDGYLLHTHGESVLRDKYAADIESAYDAMYYALAAQEGDLQRFKDLTSKNFLSTTVIETISNSYGEAVTRKAYGAQNIQHALGAVQVTVNNAARNGTNIDYKAPYDTNDFAQRAKSTQSTEAATDTTSTNAHTNTDTHAQHTDTETADEHTDSTTRNAILTITARDYYELEKLLINENMYNELSKIILTSVCVCNY